MAQPTYEYSGVCYTATSGQTTFALTSSDGNPIGYLSPDHIHVRTSANSGETWVPLPVNTAWTFADPATSIVLVTPATAGEWVDIQRKTPIDKDWVDFQSGSLLTAGQLNEAETFSLYCDQELGDEVGNITPPEIGLATTDDLPEGQTNLYYTDERVAEYIAENPSSVGVTKIIPGTNITLNPSTGEGVVTINSTGGGGSGGVSYKGLVDITQPAPANPQEGDLWVNTTAGIAESSWVGIAGQSVGIGDEPIYNGAYFDVFPRPPIVGAVESVNNQTGVVTIGVEELANFEEYPEATTRPVSEAFPVYVPNGAPGGLQIAEWAYQSTGAGNSTVILCSTDAVVSGFLNTIKEGDTVTFQYQKSTLSGPQYTTESGTVLSRYVANVNYFYLKTTALLQNHLPEALIFTHNVPTSGEKYPTTDFYPTFVPDIGEGFTSISQWSFQSDQPGRAYAILCGSTEVLDGYRTSIEVNDLVTFEYTITNIITGNASPVTETHPVLSFAQVTPSDGSLPYVRIETQCTFQALNSSYPLYFTHSAFASGSTPDGHVLQWNATDNKWTPGTNTVEQLADFAYYPSSSKVTILGPQVSTSLSPQGTEFTGRPNLAGGSIFQFRKETNLPFFNGVSQLSDGDIIELGWNNVGEQRTDVVPFGSIVESDQGDGYTLCTLTVRSGLGSMNTGNYFLSVYSPLITNGEEPIRTGQALLYDQTTKKWRPEDIAAELNISALPALP